MSYTLRVREALVPKRDFGLGGADLLLPSLRRLYLLLLIFRERQRKLSRSVRPRGIRVEGGICRRPLPTRRRPRGWRRGHHDRHSARRLGRRPEVSVQWRG